MAAAPTYNVRSNIPVPDPSEITSREIAKLRAEMEKQYDAALAAAVENAAARRDSLSAAIAALDDKIKVIAAAAETATQHSSERFNDKLHALSVLTDERFEGLKIAFREDKIAAATAVAAAFAAQEKLSVAQNLSNTAAITKSEGSTTKELESLDEKIGTLKESVASDIRNLEGRLNRGEGGAISVRETRADNHANTNQTMLFVTSGVAVISLTAAIVFGISAMNSTRSTVLTTPAVVPLTH
jgi:hypothetical protein